MKKPVASANGMWSSSFPFLYALKALKLCAGLVLMGHALSVAALPTPLAGTVTITPNTLNTTMAAFTANELVTMGVPFPPCLVTDLSNFVLKDETNAEVAVFVKQTLGWPDTKSCGVVSTRAIKVQFVFDATAGAKTYTWSIDAGGRTTADLTEAAVVEVDNDNPLKRPGLIQMVGGSPVKIGGIGQYDVIGSYTYKEPRVFAIHDPAYLVESQLIPPTTVQDSSFYDANTNGWYQWKWEEDARDLNYVTSTAAYWLYDRTSTNYRQAMRRGALELYRESYLSHEFYMDHLDDTGTPNSSLCVGAFYFLDENGEHECDEKYSYVEPIKLHLALTGDDSWTPEANSFANTRNAFWKQMASILESGDNRNGTTNPMTQAAGVFAPFDGSLYTERNSGFTLQAVLNSCQMTLDSEICGWSDTIIDNMYNHQQNNPVYTTKSGYLAHSWSQHEGALPVYAKVTAVDSVNGTFDITAFVDDLSSLSAGEPMFFRGSGFNVSVTVASIVAVDAPNRVWRVSINESITPTVGLAVRKDTGSSFQPLVDEAFSPWMSAIVLDGMWQYYHWTDDATRKAKTATLIRELSGAIAAYGIDGKRIDSTTKSLIETGFGVNVLSSTTSDSNCGLVKSWVPRYAANRFLGSSASGDLVLLNYLGDDNTSQHLPETVFSIAVGLYFEEDPDKRAAMTAMLEDAMEYFEKYDCTAGNKTKTIGGAIGDPPRAFSWTNKMDPYGTYAWVKSFALSYDQSGQFTETSINDSTIANTLNLTLSGDTFAVANDTILNGTYVTITGVPAGLTAELKVLTPTTATLKLNGTATSSDLTDSVTNLTVTFLDAAFTGGNAFRITNFAKSDLAVQFKQPQLSYSATTFTENTSNNGVISNTLTITLSDDTFNVGAGTLTETTHYSVANVPAGLTAQVDIVDSTTATLSLTGTATLSDTDVSNLTLTFTDIFTNSVGVGGILNVNKNDLVVDFIDPKILYSATSLAESSSNDGSSSTVLTLTLSEDIFTVPGSTMTPGVHYTVANLPAGMNLVVNGTSNTTATVSISGRATDNVNDVANLGLTFLNAAFTTYTAAAVLDSSKNNLAIDFVNPNISYSGSTFTENASSNGTFPTVLTLTLADDTFVAGAYSSPTHFTVSNLPAGLAVTILRLTPTTATATLTGTATSHLNSDDIANLGIAFTDAAFTTYTASAVLNSSKSDLAVDFTSPSLSYSAVVFTESSNNDGSIPTAITLTLSEDTFNGGLASPADYEITGVPTGLTAALAFNTATTATLTLTGNAAVHTDAADLSNLSVVFNDSAFTGGSAAAIENSSKNDLAINFVEPGVTYDTDTFVENSSNDGSTSTVLTLTLVGDRFRSGTFSSSSHYTVQNLPAGLVIHVTRVSDSTVTLTLSGNAASKANSNDVSNLTFNLLDFAFLNNTAANVVGASKNNIKVDYFDAMMSSSTKTFTENSNNNAGISNTVVLTLLGDTFVIPAGNLSSGVHYNASNVPAGLTLSVVTTSATSATVTLSGTATSHANADDIANLTLNFTNAAFSGGSASGIQGSSISDFAVNFIDPAPSTGGGGSTGGGSTGGSGGSTGSSSVTGSVSNITVPLNGTVQNSGTITNLTNSGTVQGGTLAGTVTNNGTVSGVTLSEGSNLTGGSLAGNVTNAGTVTDVTVQADAVITGGKLAGTVTNSGTVTNVALENNATVDGGKVSGAVTGTGTLKNVLLDASSVDSTISIGAGSKITKNTAKTISGLNLTAATLGSNGKIDVDTGILVDESEQVLTLKDVAATGINSFFASTGTETSVMATGQVDVSHPDLGKRVVPVLPKSVVTTAAADGLRLTPDGELKVVSNGVEVTFSPASADQGSVDEGLGAIGATTDAKDDGLFLVSLGNSTFSIRFSLFAEDAPATIKEAGSALAVTGNEASFVVKGNLSKPATYRIVASYPDGRTQELLPFLHDLEAFTAYQSGVNQTFVVNPMTGVVRLFNSQGTLEWRGMPGYNLVGSDKFPEIDAQITDIIEAGDVNGDGYDDLYFHTPTWTQLIYRLP